MIKVKEISDYIDKIAPYDSKCDWDNCGVLVGDIDKEVKMVGFCLDLTSETFTDARENGVDLIITHHPIIFKAQKNFLKGDLAFELASSGISALSAHTCFDCAENGVNDVLCEVLDIKNAVGVSSDECAFPMARIGETEPLSSLAFAEKVSDKLNTVCRLVDCGNEIRKVAVCGGSGMDFMDDVIRMGADAFVTGDINHHQMLDAKEKGLTVVAAGHFETEVIAMERLKELIIKEYPDLYCVMLDQTNPVKFIGKRC